ncbi:hypothetical protein Trydic_g19970 [Trypoxylus dichotomus]
MFLQSTFQVPGPDGITYCALKHAPRKFVMHMTDEVWHQELLLKMHRAAISKPMVRFVHSYLRKRASWKGSGPQSGRLQQECRKTTAHVNLAMYADDVCFFARSTAVSKQPSTLCRPGMQNAMLFSRGGLRRRRHGNPAELTFQGRIISATSDQIPGGHVRFPSELGNSHTSRPRPRTSNVWNPLSVTDPARKARTFTRMRNRCDHPYEQTPSVPESDTADSPQRSLVCKEHHATQRRRGGATHRLRPKNSHSILRPSGRSLKPPRVGVLGLRLQHPLELRSPTVTRRRPSGLAAEHRPW